LRSPVDFEVRQLIASVARKSQEEPGGKAALKLDHLRRICRTLSDEPMEVRDRAVLLIGFRSGWRRSELSALRLADVTLSIEGIRLHMGRSKTDQEGKGRYVGVGCGRSAYICPVRALNAWLDIRGRRKGPLFLRFNRWGEMTDDPMSGRAICDLVKRGVERIGEDPRDFGAHSLRSGLVTAAVEAGKSEIMIMDRTGHRSIATLKRYLKSTNLFALDPLAGVV
jgi:integrase